MISKTHKSVPLLQIDNLHTPECGVPPALDATAKFVSYFENGFGEQWVLVGDQGSGRALVYAGDCHWGKTAFGQIRSGAVSHGAGKLWGESGPY